MANDHHLRILDQGVGAWNRWRTDNPDIRPNLRGANLSDRDLTGINLDDADLDFARLTSANLTEATLNRADMLKADLSPTPLEPGTSRMVPTNLTDAKLVGARLHDAALVYAQFVRADLTNAQLWWADAYGANFFNATLVRTEITEARLFRTGFRKANLTGAYLSESHTIKTSFVGATLVGCNVYGVSAWDVDLNGATQAGLVITPPSAENPQPVITVDDLEVAQFIYLLVENQNIRRAVDTIMSKMVLILGRFTDERKAVLDAIKKQLRNRDYLPVLFDFEGPDAQTPTETIATLARLSRFVIADVTDPRSAPHELGVIANTAVGRPVQSIVLSSQREYGMLPDLIVANDWFLDIHRYDDFDHLLSTFEDKVLAPAEAKAEELEKRRRSQ